MVYTLMQAEPVEISEMPVWVSVQPTHGEADSVSNGFSNPAYDDRAIRIQQRTASDVPVSSEYENISREYRIQIDNWYYLYRKMHKENDLHYFGYEHFDEDDLSDMRVMRQTGALNRALILQFHNQHNIEFEQEGVDNQIIISQTDSLSIENNSANVKQRGSGNRATIIQNR